jgi:thermitase
MKSRVLRVIVCLGLLVISTAGESKEYVAKLKNKTFFTESFSFNAKEYYGDFAVVEISETKLTAEAYAETLNKLLTNPNVEYVVENFKIKSFNNFSADAFKEGMQLKPQWALEKVNANAAWEKLGKGSRKVKVAVIDTGVDYTHKNLKSNSVQGKDFAENDDDPMDRTGPRNPGHGTHCAGIIGANGDVEDGISGISPTVSIVPVRFLKEDGSGDLVGALKSIDYAIEQKVDVISASWGAAIDRENAKPLIEAVEKADKAGIIFVAAASNDGANNDSFEVYPANSNTPNMITVAASDPDDHKPSWSNYGAKYVHLSSPGLKIMSTLPKDTYGELSGTSMATPLVSGLVALLKSKDPSLTGAEVKALLQITGTKVEIETACNCRVDASSAADALLTKKPYLVPQATTIKVGETVTFAVKNLNSKAAWSVSDTAVATVDANGVLTAKAKGSVTVTAKTKKEGELNSMLVQVLDGSESGGGGGGGGAEQCPFDPQTCGMLCQLEPKFPWCN